MAKKKAPARKGGAKKCAPAKAVKRKPIPQQVTEREVRERILKKGHAVGKSEAAEAAFKPADGATIYGGAIKHPTVEEQFDSSDRWRYAIQPGEERTLPAPPPPGPKSKFWRQYQDETGKFIGWRKALTKTKDQVISRLRLRKKLA